MDSYRVEKKAAMKIQLPDKDVEIDPAVAGDGRKPEPELDLLSNILREFNDLFGNHPWSDGDRVRRAITTDIPDRVAADPAYRNALRDDTELFRLFSDNESFRGWLTEKVFGLTYERPAGLG